MFKDAEIYCPPSGSAPRGPLIGKDEDAGDTPLDLVIDRLGVRAGVDRRLDQFEQHLGDRAGSQV